MKMRLDGGVLAAAFSLAIGLHIAGSAAMAVEKIKIPEWKTCSTEAWGLTGAAREEKINQALELAKACKQADGYPESECLFELGVYYFEQGQRARAEQNFKEAAALKTSGMDKMLRTNGYVPGILPAYSDIAQEKKGKTHDLANCLNWLGRAYFEEHKYREAQDAFGRALKLLDTSNDPQHEAIIFPDTLQRAAQVERKLNNEAEAKKLDERAQYILSHRQLLDR